MTTALLQADRLSAGYEGPVVGPLSFLVSPGEVVVLSGPNGCGKSTLLGAVLGEASIFSGTLNRREGVRLACQRQNDCLAGELPVTGEELLALDDASPATLPDYLQAVCRRRIDCLSGGQRQLLRVWTTLASPARLLLLDEPTNNLDPAGEALLADYLRALPADRGVLLVCHEPDFVEQVAHRVIKVS